MSSNPIELLEKIAKMPPGPEKDKMLGVLKANLPKEWISEQVKIGLAERAREWSADGFAAYYYLLNGFKLSRRLYKKVKKFFKAWEDNKGVSHVGYRGSWKSVTFSVQLVSFGIGLFPLLTNLIVSAGDLKANAITLAISNIIKDHPEWKRVFPNVVPGDKWGEEGYTVWDNRFTQEQWAEKRAGIIDPTLIGGGIGSAQTNGKHPTLFLVMDDLQDPKNSSTEQARMTTTGLVKNIVLKTAVKDKNKLVTKIMNIGVVWAEDDTDVHHLLKGTGGYVTDENPVMERAEPEAPDAVYIDGVNPDTKAVYEDIKGWWHLSEPEQFGVSSILQERALGKAEFWQMMMLDMATASTGRLKYYPFDEKEVQYDWYTIGGADPTNTFKEGGNTGSHFALAYVARLPQGGAVVIDGVLERCSQLTAENYILSAQTKFPNWQYTAVENVGGGAGFIQTLQRNSQIRIMASGLKGISDARIRSKRDRILNDMARWFEDGTVKISNANTPFLNALRRLFDRFFDLDPEHSPEFDAGDSVYHALKNMPDVLYKPKVNGFSGKKERVSLLKGFNTHVGY